MQIIYDNDIDRDYLENDDIDIYEEEEEEYVSPPNPLLIAIQLRKQKEQLEAKLKKEKEDEEKEYIESNKFKEIVTPHLNWVTRKSHIYDDIFSFDNEKMKKAEEEDSTFIVVKKSKKNKKKDEEPKVNTFRFTQFCEKFLSGKNCNGNCNYAHSYEDFSFRDCDYQKTGGCRLVRKYSPNKYMNNKNHQNRKCDRLHDGESNINYFIRMNIKLPITPEDIEDATKHFFNINVPLQMKTHLQNLPSNKSIIIEGIHFYGQLKTVYKEIKQVGNSWMKKNNLFKKPEQVKNCWNKPNPIFHTNVVTKTKVNHQKVIKRVVEDPQKVYIRNKNLKMVEIKTMKLSIERTQLTIQRIKKVNDINFLKKFEKEFREKIKKLTILEKDLSELKVEINVPVIEEKVIKQEERKIEKKVETPLQILEIIVPNMKKDLQIPNMKKEISDTEGWIEVSKKPQQKKEEEINLRTQVCNSVFNKTKCPYGKKCRFAHYRNEINPQLCNFTDCRLIKYDSSGVCINREKHKICSYKHKNDINYISRVGL